jgi:hypothetical protein
MYRSAYFFARVMTVSKGKGGRSVNGWEQREREGRANHLRCERTEEVSVRYRREGKGRKTNSARTWSNPTFCPREWTTELPHTVALLYTHNTGVQLSVPITREAQGRERREKDALDLLRNVLVNLVTKVLDGRLALLENDGGRVVGDLDTARFGVDTGGRSKGK